MAKVFRLLFVVCAVFLSSFSLFAYPNLNITRTNIPGEFFVCICDSTGNVDPPYGEVNLFRAREYGDSLEIIYGDIQYIEYHSPSNILYSPYRISFDQGYTFEQWDNPLWNPFDWVQSTDELIACDNNLYFSQDTLMSWNLQFSNEDLEGNYVGTSDMRCIGWQNQEYIFSTFHMSGHQADSISIYWSNNFGQNFNLISTNSRISRYAKLFRGFEPGELYVFDKYLDSLFASIDTGRTWESKEYDVFLSELSSEQEIEIEPGWNAGELFLIIYTENPYMERPYFQLYYSSDFGDNWEAKYIFLPGIDTNVEDNSISLIESFDVQIWPNPTNGQIKVQLPEACFKQISVYNILGKRVLSKEVYNNSWLDMNLNSLPSGTYFLQVQDEKENLSSRKFILLK